MARLLQWINGRSHELSRDYLAIPIEHLPKLIAMVDKSRPQLDTRALRWGLKDLRSPARTHTFATGDPQRLSRPRATR